VERSVLPGTLWSILGLALISGACSAGGAPLTPTPQTPAATPSSTTPSTISGRVAATNGGQALTGVSVAFNGQQSITGAEGGFSYQTPPVVSLLSMTGAGILSRALVVNASTSRDLSVDAIALSGGFDLDFYRKFVRNGYEEPAALQPLRRWTQTPSFYLKTVDEAGAPLTDATLAMIETVLKDGVPRWTSGALGTPVIERGTGTRVGQSGWITVKFPFPGDPNYCGHAQVGVDGGWIELETHGNGSACRTASSLIAPRTIRHELGHALGFYHTGDSRDVMSGTAWYLSQGDDGPAARELYHAALAYKRPVGNRDPDNDPTSAVALAPMAVH
jgi:hypothetical protein